MRHLFLAATDVGFGEALHGVRLAQELLQQGDEVLFLAPSGLSPLLAGAGAGGARLRHGQIDLALPRLDQAVCDVIRKERPGTLVLLDLAAVFKVLRAVHLRPSDLVDEAAGAGARVIGLDVWNLPETDLSWDYGPEVFQLDPAVLGVERRLVPVPFVRPEGAPGTYNALPPLAPLSPEERQAVRADLGLREGQRLLLWPSALWQHPRAQIHPHRQRLAGALPGLVVPCLEALGPEVLCLHVGPEPFPAAVALGARYRFLPRQPEERFNRLLGAADLLLGFNVAATSVVTALAADVPVLIGINTRTDAELPPFLAWPLCLRGLLSPVLRDNPYLDAVRVVEVLDRAALTAACQALLFEEDAARAARARQRAYAGRVRLLPRGPERLRSLL